MRGTLRATAALIAVIAAGCSWLQSGYDAGKSNANPFENHVTAANVATLEDHTIPEPDSGHGIRTFITAQGWLFLIDGVNVYASTVASCPTANGSPCPIVWQAPASHASALASDGTRLFVSTGTGIDVRALDGALLGHLGFGGAQITIAGGSVWTTQDVVTTSGTQPIRYWLSHDLYQFPTDCDPHACTPAVTQHWDPGDMIIGAGDEMTFRGPDIAVSDGRAYQTRIRDGRAVTPQGVYDLSDPACQSPKPACQPVGTYDGVTYVGAVAPKHVFGLRVQQSATASTRELQWLPGARTACPGTPATCSPIARADFGPTTGLRTAAVGGDVVYAGTSTGVVAFAENGTTNCTTATPRVCSPLAHFDSREVLEIQVVDRRVYASTGYELHILTIPGDVK